MVNRKELDRMFAEHRYTDFKWIKPAEIVVSHWVRLKCMFGCDSYGENAACPPNTPSVPECRRLFDEYKDIAIFHFEKSFENPDDRAAWGREINKGLLKLEREVFLSGLHKAFVLFMDECRLCDGCPGKRTECTKKKEARPSPEGLAVDVFATARNCGYTLEVLTDYGQVMNRYALLLIE